MRLSKLFGITLRDAPSGVDIASHQLLLRAGYVRQLSAGIYSYLTLAQRSLLKVEEILRQEMNRIGGQEINMPVVHPAELWQQSGRWDEIDDTMARFVDRRGRDMLLAMTHEESVAQLAASEIQSYRQLPLLVYQIQTKFRDEKRARGGLIRVREFVMKDSYSLDRNVEDLEAQYAAHFQSYLRIGRRVDLPLAAVESDVGMMGGKVAHEFMYITPIGEDRLALCSSCGYAANREVARFVKPPVSDAPEQAIEKVHTPGQSTIEALAGHLGIEPAATGKVVFFTATLAAGGERLVMVVVRGDMEVNEIAVARLVEATDLRTAHEDEIAASGAVAGYASPVGLDPDKILVLVDDLVAASPGLVMGANEADHHLLHVRSGRDYEPAVVGDVVGAWDGAPCIVCGSPLALESGIEVGNIFQLGTRYTEALAASYTDEEGGEHPIVMGSYGIGVGRLLACVAEHHRDDRGLALPMSVAPFHLHLVSMARSDETKAHAERIYGELQDAGIEVLFDDRDASPGQKMAEADLLGMPLRLVVSERSVKAGGAELKARLASDGEVLPMAEVAAAVRAEVDRQLAALREAADGVPAWSS